MNPINGQAACAESRREPNGAAGARSDWQTFEIVGLLQAPLLELLDEARAVHQRHHADGQVQLASLLSIKTGACPEDCKYCPQSAHYAKNTGLGRESLLDVDDVLAKAQLAKEAGATRFCMGAAWRSVKDGPAFDSVRSTVGEVRAPDVQGCGTPGSRTAAAGHPPAGVSLEGPRHARNVEH